MTHILLFANSPRVGRYFTRLKRSIREVTIHVSGVWGVPPRRERLPEDAIDEIIDYGMRRKAARADTGPKRLAMYRQVYATAARLHYNHASARIQALRPDAVGVWGGNAVDARAVVVAARRAQLPCVHFENGFLPDTTQVDLRGVNARGTVPRDPVFYLRRGGRWRTAEAVDIVPRKPRRGKNIVAPIALPPRYVFVPFQERYDSQVLLNSPWIRSMEALFDTVIAARRSLGDPTLSVVFKEHPSCRTRYEALHRRAAEMDNVHFTNGNSTGELIARSLGVVTINSSVGSEALMLGKPVLALGDAVYGIPGVASTAGSIGEVSRYLQALGAGCAPEAPLREAFLCYLAEDHLIPDRHQQPGRRHFAAVGARLARIVPRGHHLPERIAERRHGLSA